MIVIRGNEAMIELPIYEKCKIPECQDVYQLILLHRFTRQVVVFKIRDLNFGWCPVRYKFRFTIPDWVLTGEYTYYLVTTNEWIPSEIDRNFVVDSYRKTDKEAITIDGKFIVIDNKILVTKWFKSKLGWEGDEWQVGCEPILFDNDSKDDSSEGKIVDYMTILHTGIIKYFNEEVICCGPLEYEGKDQKEYIEYNG